MINPFQNDALGKLILRLTVGVLMLFHGIDKITNTGSVEFIGGKLAETGLPSAVAYGVYLGEVIAPLMIVFGFFSRVGGLITAGNMLFAIGLMHTGGIFALTNHGGWALELQGFYLFGALAIVFLGSGRFALKPD
ncbi:MAG: DoxX family protein [Gammaproteobacteria bacterium]|nr:DoxX family protein [Gammaproteobacteria bacterium]